MNFFYKCFSPKFTEEDIIPRLSKKFWDKLEPKLSNGYVDGTISIKGNSTYRISEDILDRVIMYINTRHLSIYSLQKLASIRDWTDHDGKITSKIRYEFSFKINDPPEYKL